MSERYIEQPAGAAIAPSLGDVAAPPRAGRSGAGAIDPAAGAAEPAHTKLSRLLWRWHGRGSQAESRHALDGYVVAVIATAVALVVRLVWGMLFRGSSPFLFFAPAVMLSAWYGGRGPGLFATVAGAVAADFFLLAPSGVFSNTTDDVAKIAIFLVVGAQISWLSGALLTAKQRAESDAEAARRSEQLYRTLAQNFPSGAVFLVDGQMRVALAEGRALAAAGISGERVRGQPIWRAFDRALLRAALPLMRRAAVDAAAVAEVRHRGRVYLVQVLPLRGDAGQRFAGMGIAQDITELVTAREALQAAHDELEVRVRERTAELEFQKTLLEAQSNASLDGILVASDDGRVIFHNRQLPELWRLPDAAFAGTLDQAVGAMRGLLIAHQDPLGEDEEAIPVSSGELPSNLSLCDGRTLECYSAPVRSGEGRSYGSVWYFRDVTERRRVSRQILEAGERERRRIGQDLHDDLCQHLTGITCLGRVLQQRLDGNLPKEADAAGQIVDLLEQAVKRARDIARGLQPLHLEAEGLAASLQELSANISAMFQVQCHFACAGPIAIDDPACPIQLYRIAQEAISNAIRHGKAKNIFIDLVQLGDRVILTVEDDGVGIDPAPARPGLGLRTMRHRARMIGATLLVEPADGEGTVVTCKVAAKSAAVQPENAHESEIA